MEFGLKVELQVFAVENFPLKVFVAHLVLTKALLQLHRDDILGLHSLRCKAKVLPKLEQAGPSSRYAYV